MPLTTSLDPFVANLSPNPLPEEAARVGRMGSIGLAAQFRIALCMASGIVEQRVGPREPIADLVRRPDIQALTHRVKVATTAYEPDLPGAAPHAQVVVSLKDRRSVAGTPVVRAMGHPPLTNGQLYDNFDDCLDAGRSPIWSEIPVHRRSALQSIIARDRIARP